MNELHVQVGEARRGSVTAGRAAGFRRGDLRAARAGGDRARHQPRAASRAGRGDCSLACARTPAGDEIEVLADGQRPRHGRYRMPGARLRLRDRRDDVDDAGHRGSVRCTPAVRRVRRRSPRRRGGTVVLARIAPRRIDAPLAAPPGRFQPRRRGGAGSWRNPVRRRVGDRPARGPGQRAAGGRMPGPRAEAETAAQACVAAFGVAPFDPPSATFARVDERATRWPRRPSPISMSSAPSRSAVVPATSPAGSRRASATVRSCASTARSGCRWPTVSTGRCGSTTRCS